MKYFTQNKCTSTQNLTKIIKK